MDTLIVLSVFFALLFVFGAFVFAGGLIYLSYAPKSAPLESSTTSTITSSSTSTSSTVPYVLTSSTSSTTTLTLRDLVVDVPEVDLFYMDDLSFAVSSDSGPVVGALVYLDGEYLGPTDYLGEFDLLSLDGGSHSIIVSHVGFRNF